MKISNLFFTVGLVALSGVVLAQDEADSIGLKEYFNSREGLASEEHRERFKDFRVSPASPQVTDTTEYTLEFSVTSETFFKIVDDSLVFLFPEGFGLSKLGSASITTDFRYVFLFANVEVDGRFVILSTTGAWIDTLWDSTMVPERIHFEIKLFDVINPEKAKKYQIIGAALNDEKFVAWPKKSEPFEITEDSQENKAELQIVSTELVAPNSPKVNTNQEVAVEVLVANVGNKTAHNVSVGLLSDGESDINSPKSIELLEAGDTATVWFEVTAAGESETESFTSDIISGNVTEVEPLDDTAGAVIQTPAFLILNTSILDGDTIYVDAGQSYFFSIEVTNEGEGSVIGGRLQFDDGIIFDISGQTVFTIIAPPYETIESHFLTVVDIPIDANTLEPAALSDTEIVFTEVVDGGGSKTFEQSFIVENNPFNPNDGPVRFVYNLQSASDVEFNIFTVTGEEVYSHTYLSGSEGGKSGTNQIQWDGRNTEGEMVLNGVYVTMLNVIATGEKASLKLAVLK